MKTIVTFLSEEFEELESTTVDANIFQTLDLLKQVDEFRVGEDVRLRYEKSGWFGLDLAKSEIEVVLKTES